uniref:Uncharacterized protein n=1 Tax=Podoviridae sp. ctz6O13 TaxID=2827757 RepID=A0A8S5TK98_9CAUD|nr:MAG TPA: hypothetical protein [Podoviridae sp. ctz6O13]
MRNRIPRNNRSSCELSGVDWEDWKCKRQPLGRHSFRKHHTSPFYVKDRRHNKISIYDSFDIGS